MFDAGVIVFGNEMLTDCFLWIDGIDGVVCAIYQVKHLRRDVLGFEAFDVSRCVRGVVML